MSMETRAILKATALGVLLAAVAIRSAHAVNGVIEINQTRAKAGGVTPGDTPLFPVRIDQPGSYRLTSNLDVTDASARPGGTAAEDTTAIRITADNVTVDLNGFAIMGPTTCSGTPLMCTPTGLGHGIDGTTSEALAAVNGTVRGMGADGIRFLGSTRAEGIHAVSNGGEGISASIVTNCIASSNNRNGILGGTTVTGSTATRNRLTGITATTVTGCTANVNAGNGIGGSTVANSTAGGNGLIGITATTVTGCTAVNNTTNLFGVDGIMGHNICGPPNAPCP